MKVFKFGGATVKDAEGVKNMANILKDYTNEPPVIILSAMGKTTNTLEKLTQAYYYGRPELMDIFHKIRNEHLQVVEKLYKKESKDKESDLILIFNKLESIISDNGDGPPAKDILYDFVYDMIVPFGELLSTTLVSQYLNHTGIKNKWLDARNLIRADHTYREGKVLWDLSEEYISNAIPPILNNGEMVLTQGFIAGTVDGKSITLGREGSDYSAAIFSSILNARACYIWKDVPGLMNADPKIIPEAVLIDRISYGEAIELAYYGAKVIHYKTLKPLRNKRIPLFVKSFVHPEKKGTVIEEDYVEVPVTSYIIKNNQVLISISPKDYSFIGEDNLYNIFRILLQNHIKINLMQNSALSFSICLDNNDKIDKLLKELSSDFNVKFNKNLELITIRHFTEESINFVLKKRKTILEQRSRATIQMLVEN